jgi:hypothetical protein
VGVHKRELFERQLEELGADLPRIDQAIRGAEFLLSEHPDAGIPTSVPGIYSFPTRLPSASGLAHVSIFYIYDMEDVHFIAMKRAPEG